MIAAVNPFTLVWLAWGVLFGAVEGLALYLRRKGVNGGTLSETAWRFGNWHAGIGHRIAKVILGTAMADLTAHLVFGTPLTPFGF